MINGKNQTPKYIYSDFKHSGVCCSLTALTHFLTLSLNEEIFLQYFLNILNDIFLRKLMKHYMLI